MEKREKQSVRQRISALVSSKAKLRLRRASRAQDRSMSAVLNDLLSTLSEDELSKAAPGKGRQWVMDNKGILKGKFKAEDFERDDLMGYLLRKHAS